MNTHPIGDQHWRIHVPRYHKKADVICEECPFLTTIQDGDDRLPADRVREHGKENKKPESAE